MIDCMSRGIAALEHAAMVSRSASRAFEDQAALLAVAKRTVEMSALLLRDDQQ